MDSGVSILSGRLSRHSRIGLAQFPTPFEPLRNLSKHLGGPMIWVKREECSGLGFGGNKLRKLDYVLNAALSQGADTVVCSGDVQCNSVRQVAAACAKLGLNCEVLLYQDMVDSTGTDYDDSGNAFLLNLYGATIHYTPWLGEPDGMVQQLVSQLKSEGRNTFVVPYGVSSVLGAVGYCSAALEIAHQSATAGIMPDAIVHSSRSGATQAGLIVGASTALPDTEVVGIDIGGNPGQVSDDVFQYAAAAAKMLTLPFAQSSVEVVAGHAGGGYGVPDQKTLEAIKLAGRLEALALDPAYSGKGLAGLISLIESGRWRKGKNVVFVNTGGGAALFGYRDSLNLR